MAKTYLATRSDIADMATNTNLSAHKNNKNNPHSVTATQIGAEVTSNRTDDIASNADSSTKYPSTKGVADYVSGGFLPLTGGTLSGDLYTGNGTGHIGSAQDFMIMTLRDDNGDTRGITLQGQSRGDLQNALRIHVDESGVLSDYNLFGEHSDILSIIGNRVRYGGSQYGFVIETCQNPNNTQREKRVLELANWSYKNNMADALVVQNFAGGSDYQYDGTYRIYGEHNVYRGTASAPALTEGCIYLQYE